jgi:isoquinoline 1-oxidoreductase beta subunit
MISRRQFIAGSGGLVVAVSVPWSVGRAEAAAAPTGSLTAYLNIAPDGTVTFHSPTTEMGQGTHTGHAVIIADELDVVLERVRVETAEPADPFRRNGSMSSGGSWGVRFWHDALHKAAAQAREMLVAAAATQLSVARDTLDTEAGEVVHGASGQRLSYGSLAAAAATLQPPAAPALRDPRKYRYIRGSAPRVDIPAKVRGEPVFASDVVRPGMVYACARLSPVYGAEVERLDPKAARAIPGVLQVVQIPGGAAVVARDSWSAMRGAEALEIRFKSTPHDALDSATISRQMRAALGADGEAIEAQNDGDVEAAFSGAAKTVEAVYEAPYLSHSPIEPWTCTLEYDSDGVLHLWAPSQSQDRYRSVAAKTAGLPDDKVRIHTMLLGGGFGRRLGPDGVPGAVRTAMAVRKPVKFFWTREDETAQGWYRPTQVARMRAALDAGGQLTAMALRTAGPALSSSFSSNGLRAGELDSSSVSVLKGSRYKPGAAFRVDWVRVDQPVPMAPWRSVGATQNGYFMECFVDEVARAAGKDPYRLRRELLAHDARALKVIDTVAEAAGWGTPLPAGRARGMAFVESYGSLCAEVAEVSLRDGRPAVHRVVCALDCGSVVLPDGVRAQVEGGVIMGMSAALREQVRIEQGRAINTNFDQYRLARISDAPERIDTIIIESGQPMGGVGEPPLPPIAPAIANAMFALTGKPARRMPLSEINWS